MPRDRSRSPGGDRRHRTSRDSRDKKWERRGHRSHHHSHHRSPSSSGDDRGDSSPDRSNNRSRRNKRGSRSRDVTPTYDPRTGAPCKADQHPAPSGGDVPSSSSAAQPSSELLWDRERERLKQKEKEKELAALMAVPSGSKKLTDEDMVGKSPDEIEMMRIMGFGSFDTSKNKKVKGNNVGEVHVVVKRKYRQYMNRKGGFNRPLDPVH